MTDPITTERERESERELDKDIASNIHGAMRDVRDKKGDDLTAQLVGMVDRLQTRLIDHMLEEKDTVKDLKADIGRVEEKVTKFISAFPNGDAVLHRLAHEAQITKSNDSHDFWGKIKFTIAALVLSGACIWVGIVLWKAVLLGPKG